MHKDYGPDQPQLNEIDLKRFMFFAIAVDFAVIVALALNMALLIEGLGLHPDLPRYAQLAALLLAAWYTYKACRLWGRAAALPARRRTSVRALVAVMGFGIWFMFLLGVFIEPALHWLGGLGIV